MRTKIIRIGNSRGIRIPKGLLDELELGDEVELERKRGELVMRRADRPRDGWEEAFRRMADAGDDALLDAGLLRASSWDEKEWRW